MNAVPREFLTDEQVEAEIARLIGSENVRLARREQRIKYKRRQVLYNLRALERRGAELAADENGSEMHREGRERHGSAAERHGSAAETRSSE